MSLPFLVVRQNYDGGGQALGSTQTTKVHAGAGATARISVVHGCIRVSRFLYLSSTRAARVGGTREGYLGGAIMVGNRR